MRKKERCVWEDKNSFLGIFQVYKLKVYTWAKKYFNLRQTKLLH